MNENYHHPARPKNVTNDMIMKGAYVFSESKSPSLRILASGLTLNFALEAKDTLKEYGVMVDVWSVTSFNELYREGIEFDRQKQLLGDTKKSYVEKCFHSNLPTISVSEYQRSYGEQIRKWINGEYLVLGTDGFGRSDTRERLRDHFEISAEHLVINALRMSGKAKEANKFIEENNILISKEAPWKK